MTDTNPRPTKKETDHAEKKLKVEDKQLVPCIVLKSAIFIDDDEDQEEAAYVARTDSINKKFKPIGKKILPGQTVYLPKKEAQRLLDTGRVQIDLSKLQV